MARLWKIPFNNFFGSTGSRQTLTYQKPDTLQKPCLVEKLDHCPKNCHQNRPYKTEPLLYHSNNSILVTVYFKHFKNNVSFWELGTITQRIGNVTYIIQSPKFELKRHLNQIRKRTTEDLVNLPQEEVETIDTVYDSFDFQPPQTMTEPRRSSRKRKFTDPLLVLPKEKEILFSPVGVWWRNHLLMDSTTLHNTGRRSNTKTV